MNSYTTITNSVDKLFIDTSSVIHSTSKRIVIGKKLDKELTLDDLNISKRNGTEVETTDSGCFKDTEQITVLNDKCFLRDLDNLDVEYPINKNNRGCFLIFNHMNYDTNLNLSPRPSSVKDANELKELFEKELKFSIVKIFQDLTKDEVLNWLKRVSKASHESYSIFACCFLSHGTVENKIYASDDLIDLNNEVFPLFNADVCSTLAMKPKVFLIQACRGSNLDRGYKIFQTSINENEKIPVSADFLIIYSTQPNFVSWKKQSGSWFIQSFINCTKKFHKKYDFLKVLTIMNRMIANMSTNDNKYRQISTFSSCLTADLHL